MAAKRPRSEDSYDDVMTCPVCKDDFKDPRLLSCGHHFCLQCLEKIAQGQEGGSIPCPACRHITKEKPADLKEYKVNEFCSKVSNFLNKKRTRIDKLCGFCDDSTPATLTCNDCHLHLCESCKENHETLVKKLGHKVTTLSESQHCPNHPGTNANCICATCDSFLCPRCAVQHDDTHSLADIKEAAGKAKERLKEIISNKDTLKKDQHIVQCVEDAIKKLENKREIMNREFIDVEESIKSLHDQVQSVKKNADRTFQKELKELQMLAHDSREFVRMKDDLIHHVTELLDSASDCEIISREREFPKYASDSVQSILNKTSIEIPKAGELRTLAYEIKTMEKDLKFKSDFVPIVTRADPLKPLEVRTSFKICSDVAQGLAYDPNDDTYVVRSCDAEKLIQVYDTSGNIIRSIGSKRAGLSNSGGITVDTRRKLYLLPTTDGKIVTFDYEGREHNVLNVNTFRLIGISYCTIPETNTDRYIVSSARYTDEKEKESHSVYIVNPINGTVLKELKKKQDISHPYSVTSFATGGELYMGAGYCNGGARLFDLNGKIVNMLKERPDGKKYRRIIGLCSDPSLGVIIGEASENTVIGYSLGDDKRILAIPQVLFRLDDITKESDRGELYAMAVDGKSRRMLITFTGDPSKVYVLEEKLKPP